MGLRRASAAIWRSLSHRATPLLMMMWRAGKLFPRSDRSPTMIPHQSFKIAAATKGKIREIERVSSGFYISQALEFRA